MNTGATITSGHQLRARFLTTLKRQLDPDAEAVVPTMTRGTEAYLMCVGTPFEVTVDFDVAVGLLREVRRGRPAAYRDVGGDGEWP